MIEQIEEEELKDEWSKKEAPQVYPLEGDKAKEMEAKMRKQAFDLLDEMKKTPNLAKRQLELEKQKLDIMENIMENLNEVSILIKEERGLPLKLKEGKKKEEKDEILVVEEKPKSEAKMEIKEYLLSNKDKTIYPSDIHLALGIPYEDVEEIIEELKDENFFEK